jgi:hypothetical protein
MQLLALCGMIGRLLNHRAELQAAGCSGLHGCEALMFPTNWGLHYSTWLVSGPPSYLTWSW